MAQTLQQLKDEAGTLAAYILDTTKEAEGRELSDGEMAELEAKHQEFTKLQSVIGQKEEFDSRAQAAKDFRENHEMDEQKLDESNERSIDLLDKVANIFREGGEVTFEPPRYVGGGAFEYKNDLEQVGKDKYTYRFDYKAEVPISHQVLGESGAFQSRVTTTATANTTAYFPEVWSGFQRLVSQYGTFSNPSVVTIVPRTDTRKVYYPVIEATSRRANVIGENTDISATDPTYVSRSVEMFKLGDAALASFEALTDTHLNLQGILTEELASSIGRGIDNQIFAGTGSGQVNGVTRELGTNGVESGAFTRADPTVQELLRLAFQIESSYQNRMRLVMTQSVLSRFRLEQTTASNAGYTLAPTANWISSLTRGITPDGSAGTIDGIPVNLSSELDAYSNTGNQALNYVLAGDTSAINVHLGPVTFRTSTETEFRKQLIELQVSQQIGGIIVLKPTTAVKNLVIGRRATS